MRSIFSRMGVGVISLLLVFGMTMPLGLSAQEGPETVSLGISPQILDLTANPGERLENTFRLTNASPQEIFIETTPKNFIPRGEEGAVDLTVDDTSFSLAEWVSVSPETVTIVPGQTQDFDVIIDVPEDAEPGSHFGSVVFSTIPPEDETANALVSQEIAPVILVKIAGDVQESAEIAEFATEKSFYSNEQTISFLSRLENTGSVHFKPKGVIIIKNMWGSQVAELELDRRNVLPDSIRQIEADWQPEGFTIGRYTATLSIVYGDSDEISVSETNFVVFPYQSILPIVFIVVLGGYVLFRSRKRLVLAAKVLSGKDQKEASSTDKKSEDS